MTAITLDPLPPSDAVAAFRQKGIAIGFAWQDIWQGEHARAFTVAKAMSFDILADIRAAVDEALAEGLTLQQFRERLTPVLQQRGWWGRQAVVDPLTGKRSVVQLGSPRRLNTIFDVNLRVSYAAGRWGAIQRTKDRRPFLRYSAVLDAPGVMATEAFCFGPDSREWLVMVGLRSVDSTQAPMAIAHGFKQESEKDTDEHRWTRIT